MGSRRKSREAALQVFFQLDFSEQKLDEALKLYWESNLVSPEVREFTNYLCHGTLHRLKEIDALIENHSTNWKISRMTAVDRNILRLATFELMEAKDIPHSVTINEAVEIAKRFGTDESASFINGILDKVAKGTQWK